MHNEYDVRGLKTAKLYNKDKKGHQNVVRLSLSRTGKGTEARYLVRKSVSDPHIVVKFISMSYCTVL
jgi:hypothetical protein